MRVDVRQTVPMTADDQVRLAGELCDRVVFEGDAGLLALSYALRHLGVVAQQAGRLDEAREHLEASTRLRRAHGFGAGVAANLVGLAYLAHAQGRHDDVSLLLDEGQALAESAGAHRITAQISEARAHTAG